MQRYFQFSLFSSALFLIFSCSSVKELKTGKSAFEKKQYSKAIDLLANEYKSESNDSKKAEIAFLLGESYKYTYDFDASVPWYETSLRHRDDLNTILSLAEAYKRTEQYKAAINAYTALFNETSQKEQFQKEIDICKEVMKWKAEDEIYNYSVMAFDGSSAYNDYGLSVYKNDQVVFISDRPVDSKEEVYEWTGNSLSTAFIANENGAFLELFDAIPISQHNDGPISFNKDFTELYFTRCSAVNLRDEHCRIYYSYWDGIAWTDPEALSFFEERVNYGNPVLFDQDSILIFSANPSSDDHDLYYSVRESYGWSQASAMPDYLNSSGNEMFPTVEEDTLYFSSDGHPGLGGLDVFKTYLRSDRSFNVPENLRRPINSGYDDFYLSVTERSNTSFEAFLSSNRGMMGGDDILKFEASLKEPDKSEEETEETVADLNSLQEIYLAVQIYGVDDTGSKVKLKSSELELSLNGESEILKDETGYFIVPVDSLDKVIAVAAAKNHLSKSDRFVISDLIPNNTTDEIYTINRVIELEPIIIGKEIVIDNIYYDFDRWNIREDAKPALNQVVQILLDNPELKMQLSAHTDCRGELDFNLDLSQKRAQSAVDYIISTGINSERLTAVGYGESSPTVNCVCDDCSEEEHQTNRRTTFKILE